MSTSTMVELALENPVADLIAALKERGVTAANVADNYIGERGERKGEPVRPAAVHNAARRGTKIALNMLAGFAEAGGGRLRLFFEPGSEDAAPAVRPKQAPTAARKSKRRK
jgi:hypothetical protein